LNFGYWNDNSKSNTFITFPNSANAIALMSSRKSGALDQTLASQSLPTDGNKSSDFDY